MSQTLLSRATRIERSKRFRTAILEQLADGKEHDIDEVISGVALRCNAISDDVAPVLSSAAANHSVVLDFVNGTVRAHR